MYSAECRSCRPCIACHFFYIFRMHKLDFKSRRMLNSRAVPTSSMHPCSPLGLAINSGIQLSVTYGGSEIFTLGWCDGVSVQGCH
jgi:hypothetical protein